MNSREFFRGRETGEMTKPAEIKLSDNEEDRFERAQLVGEILKVYRENPAGTSTIDSFSHVYLDKVGIPLAREESPNWDHVRADIENELAEKGKKIDDTRLENAWEYMRDFAETGGSNNLKYLQKASNSLKKDKENLLKQMQFADAGPESRSKDREKLDRIDARIEVVAKEIEAIENHHKNNSKD
jgi:hypothetical protein